MRTSEKKRKYSITEFSSIIGVTYATVQKWEKGHSMPKKDALKKIALLGKISEEKLLYGDLVTSEMGNKLIKPNPKEVGDQIKTIRLKLGYSLSEFGRLVEGSASATFASWESGKNIPHKNKLKIIALLGRMTKLELLYVNSMVGNVDSEEFIGSEGF